MDIKFTATTTQLGELVQGFAEFLGYENQKLDDETHQDFVARKYKEHADLFTTQWAQHRITEAVVAYKTQLEKEIIDPIKDSTVVSSESVV